MLAFISYELCFLRVAGVLLQAGILVHNVYFIIIINL